MKRWIFNIVSALSLVLCLATVGLWVRSYWRADYIDTFLEVKTCVDDRLVTTPPPPGMRRLLYKYHRYCVLHSSEGGLAMSLQVTRVDETRSNAYWYRDRPLVSSYTRFASPPAQYPRLLGQQRSRIQLGFDWIWNERADNSAAPVMMIRSARGILIPYWFLCLLMLIFPVWSLRSHICHQTRLCQHPCPTCGYDLRASKERCPECGRAIEAAINSHEDVATRRPH